ncbi:MAG: hypothetical protein U1F43_17310 [Myxococcota bacterium]
MRCIPFIVVALLLSAGCESDPFQGEIPACVCDNGGCSAQSCGISILLDQTCVGELTSAEALIGKHVEADLLKPTAAFTPCTRIEPGASVAIIVRGGPWVWGPLNETCETPGDVRSLVLQCVEAGN